MKVVVIFEGLDAAGKGGSIKRITESFNPLFAELLPLARQSSGRKRSGTSSDMSPSAGQR